MSSTVVVARIISSSFVELRVTARGRGRVCAREAGARIGRTPYGLRALDEIVLEGPDRDGGAAAYAGLLVDVLDVVPDGLGGDAEIVGDRLVRVAEHERQQHLQLAPRQAGRKLTRPFRDAVTGGGEHGVDRLRVEPPVLDLSPQLGLGRRRL